jgi:hypothetical protein
VKVLVYFGCSFCLISTKEGYLKVQGALEILDILKKKIERDDAAVTAAVMD